ncbi:carboxypeptidase regulatory-like domain-containing protein [Bifidobacterium saguinibicoloris]|uniref:carboxypeptidase regulatory-like domain-containing protein n=1 Tax=Bifidobacterium saguinibicoloris TaxID=2834433 RepID=UPI001C5734BC|nr:carboxypeptidase regulatory-like domain-containing protein [Bifidobacterium saguinibicoloris]MBW3080480.1 cadherin-like beta sandwich domain-containing protein [Bifidobacterium saguinibicoloris]
MGAFRQWAARVVTIGVSAAMAAAMMPTTSAFADASAAAGFTGYTDKTALKEAGRNVVKAGSLLVADDSAPAGDGTTYYVDSAGGDDAADGTSEATAWKTFANVNAKEFQPGDRILLKAGSTWTAEGDAVAKEAYDYTTWKNGAGTDVDGAAPTALLAPKGSGTAEKPIVLSSYGDGDADADPAPKLEGRGVVNDVLQLTNQQHWDISNLDISNLTDGFDPSRFTSDEDPKAGDLRGVHIQGESAGVLAGYDIHGLYVHDVSGQKWAIGAWGLDRSKRTGGIMFEGLKGDAKTASTFTDVTVRDNVIANTSFGNLVFKQFSGMGTDKYKDHAPGWGDRAVGKAAVNGTVKEDSDWAPHTGVTISGNYMTNRDTQFGWDSMYLTSVKGATVENNVVDGAGVSGIEMYYADDIVVQNNEVAELAARPNAADSNGIDPDRGTSNIVIQGNYVHDSGEGILLCGFGFSTAVVRYNIIQDVERYYVNGHGSTGVNAIYNNLMVNTIKPWSKSNGNVGFFGSSGSSYFNTKNLHYVFNNTFVNLNAKDVKGVTFSDSKTGVTFSNNAYWGEHMTPAAADQAAVTDDPKIGNPAEGLDNAKPGEGSPLIGAGKAVDLAAIMPGFTATGADGANDNPIAADFFGNPIADPPSIGPAGVQADAEAGTVTGTVKTADGTPVEGATVTADGDAAKTASTNAAGAYTLSLKAGGHTLVATAPGHKDSAATTVTVAKGQTVAADLTLGEATTTTGTIAGTTTVNGSAVGGITVTLKDKDGKTLDTTTSTLGSADPAHPGAYSFAVAPGEGYTVTASRKNYATRTVTDVAVKLAQTTTVDFDLVKTTDDTTLGSLTATSAYGDLTFTQAEDGTYAADAGPYAETATLTAKANSAGAKVAINGGTASAAATADVPLATGPNNVELVVTSKSGRTATYTAVITRADATQTAALKALAVDGHELTPAFDHTRLGAENPYTVTVPDSVKSLTLTFTRGWDGQTVLVNGAKTTGDTADVALTDGENTIDVNVDEFAGDTADYVIKVARSGSGGTTPNPPATDLSPLLSADFTQQTDPENLGFTGNAAVTDGTLTGGTDLAAGKAVKAALPIAVRAQKTAEAQFTWKADATAKSGIELRDAYGRLLFAIAAGNDGSKQTVRYATAAPRDIEWTASTVGAKQFRNGEPTWTATEADATAAYQVKVRADFTAGTVTYAITPAAGGDPIVSGEAATRATSMAALFAVNYEGTAVHTIDDVLFAGATKAADLDLPLNGKTAYAFGDSIVAGHKYADASFATFAGAEEGVTVRRYAQNGATVIKGAADWSTRYLAAQIDKAPAASPDMVIFDGGTNDAMSIDKASDKWTTAMYEEQLGGVIDQMKAKWPDAKIVFVQVPKLNTRDAAIQATLHDIQDKVCAAKGVTVADVYDTFEVTDANQGEFSFTALGSTGLPQTSGSTSGTHPNFPAIERYYVPVVRAAMRAAFAGGDTPNPPDGGRDDGDKPAEKPDDGQSGGKPDAAKPADGTQDGTLVRTGSAVAAIAALAVLALAGGLATTAIRRERR